MIDLDEKLWLEYIQAIQKYNTNQIELDRELFIVNQDAIKKQYREYDNLPRWKKIFKQNPREFRPSPLTNIEPFIIKASIEGYLTWKAKGKKL